MDTSHGNSRGWAILPTITTSSAGWRTTVVTIVSGALLCRERDVTETFDFLLWTFMCIETVWIIMIHHIKTHIYWRYVSFFQKKQNHILIVLSSFFHVHWFFGLGSGTSWSGSFSLVASPSCTTAQNRASMDIKGLRIARVKTIYANPCGKQAGLTVLPVLASGSLWWCQNNYGTWFLVDFSISMVISRSVG